MVHPYSDGHWCQKGKTFTTQRKNSMNFGDYSLGTIGTNSEDMFSDQYNIYLTHSPFFTLDYDLGSQIL